ncbi:MAG: hypothetical protein QM770_13835 [Tepidisphaeraceae bacterium]
MYRLLEILLGLDRGFLSRDGDFSLTFNPAWPGQNVVGAVTWNLLLVGLAIALVVFIYQREGAPAGRNCYWAACVCCCCCWSSRC